MTSQKNQHITQNQFSAYLKKAVHFRRIRYLTNHSRIITNEVSLTENEYALPDKTDVVQKITDYGAIQQAIKSIKNKERHIIRARIVDEESFDRIAKELGMTRKAVMCLYYRILKKLRQHMGDGDKQ